MNADSAWPELPYPAWKDTYETLHLWMQVIGKIALAKAPPLNHSWGVAFQVTPRGLSTRTLPHEARCFSIAFDFIEHQLVIRTSDGDTRNLALKPRSVADFLVQVTAMLDAMGLPVHIWPVSVELPQAIRLDQDTRHRSYDPRWANRVWRILAQVQRVFTTSRCAFIGKCSPVHFFWGSFDLAVTRFSGRRAPPREGPAFMREAYSHEVISHGFWPGNEAFPQPAFYAYAVPEPAELKQVRVKPVAATYRAELGEFILPYDAVRESGSPQQDILDFIESTYACAADLAGWDRASLERTITA